MSACLKSSMSFCMMNSKSILNQIRTLVKLFQRENILDWMTLFTFGTIDIDARTDFIEELCCKIDEKYARRQFIFKLFQVSWCRWIDHMINDYSIRSNIVFETKQLPTCVTYLTIYSINMKRNKLIINKNKKWKRRLSFDCRFTRSRECCFSSLCQRHSVDENETAKKTKFYFLLRKIFRPKNTFIFSTLTSLITAFLFLQDEFCRRQFSISTFSFFFPRLNTQQNYLIFVDKIFEKKYRRLDSHFFSFGITSSDLDFVLLKVIRIWTCCIANRYWFFSYLTLYC